MDLFILLVKAFKCGDFKEIIYFLLNKFLKLRDATYGIMIKPSFNFTIYMGGNISRIYII